MYTLYLSVENTYMYVQSLVAYMIKISPIHTHVSVNNHSLYYKACVITVKYFNQDHDIAVVEATGQVKYVS